MRLVSTGFRRDFKGDTFPDGRWSWRLPITDQQTFASNLSATKLHCYSRPVYRETSSCTWRPDRKEARRRGITLGHTRSSRSVCETEIAGWLAIRDLRLDSYEDMSCAHGDYTATYIVSVNSRSAVIEIYSQSEITASRFCIIVLLVCCFLSRHLVKMINR